MLRVMVIILNIDIIRALTGDYHDIVISKDNIKCYGYRIVKSFRNGFLDIGDISKDKLIYTVIEDFLRKDILVFAPDASKDMKDIISRKDGKTLRIDRSLLSSVNNDLLNLLNTRIRKSISNMRIETLYICVAIALIMGSCMAFGSMTLLFILPLILCSFLLGRSFGEYGSRFK